MDTEMDTEETEQQDMIDMLAFNCCQLFGEIAGASTDKETKLLEDYLKKVDNEHKSIEDFHHDLDWFNVTEPLSLKESLRGKIVILDFFTYCCINCLHMLPDLKKIEKLFSVEDGLVVIGVHSAKFYNEKDSANILSAVQKYDITHPVVNDLNSLMWAQLNLQCWPTLVVLGPRANPLFVLMGEGHYNALEKYVKATITYYKKKGQLNGDTLPLHPSTNLLTQDTNLKFPGKIVCSKQNEQEEKAELYAVSDSGNHRVLIINSQGETIQTIGGNSSGFVDGNFKTAKFNSPQGLAFLNNDILFVADTENHAIRKINLKLKTVETAVGIGKQGHDRVGGKLGKEQEISSPWDVAVYRTKDMDMSFHMDENAIPEKELLLIAMAGTHQIWALFLEDVIWWKFKKCSAGTCAAIAGNGNEENRNNAYPNNASFAQPSGIAISKDSKELFIADSESSCIRKVSLADGKVSAVVGGERNPQNLFAFGDIDGKQYNAKLQHPLGVGYNHVDKSIYIADTYNHKIKKIDPAASTVTTCNILDSSNNKHIFNEPGGLCFNPRGDIMYIADTNNHLIEKIYLPDMKVTPLKISFESSRKKLNLGKAVQFEKLKLKPQGGKIRLSINLNLNTDIHFTEDAPQKWNAYLPNDLWYISQQNGDYKTGSTVDIDVTAPEAEGSGKEEQIFTITFKLSLCAKNICFPKIFSIQFPVVYDKEGLDCIIEDVSVTINEKDIKL